MLVLGSVHSLKQEPFHDCQVAKCKMKIAGEETVNHFQGKLTVRTWK